MQKSESSPSNQLKIYTNKLISKAKKKSKKKEYDFYNFLLSKLQTKKIIKISNEEGIYFTLFLELYYKMDSNNILYLHYFENFKPKINEKTNKEKIFKFFIIYSIMIWGIANKFKNESSTLSSCYEIIKFLIGVFCKLYKEEIFNYEDLEIFSKLLLILSIYPYELNYKTEENIFENNSIKSFLFLNLSVQMYKKIFSSNLNIKEEEQKTILNYLNFFYENFLKTRISTQLMFSNFDIKVTRFYDFIEILPDSKEMYEIIINIYTSIYKNRFNENIITLFLKVLKKGLINIEDKTILELKKDISSILFPLHYLFKVDNLEGVKFLIQKGFYLEAENSGFYFPICTLSDKFSIFFSFNFNPIIKPYKDYSLLTIIQKNEKTNEIEKIFFRIKISKKENTNKYTMNFIINKNENKEDIEVNPGLVYLIYTFFSKNGIKATIQQNRKNNEYYIKGNIFKGIRMKDLEFLLGCHREIERIGENFSPKIINTYQGYFGCFLLFKKDFDEKVKKKKEKNYEEDKNEKEYIFHNIINNYLNLCYENNDKKYGNIYSSLEFKLTPNLFIFYDKIEKIDFTEFHDDYSEKKGRKKRFCYLIEKTKSIKKNQNYSYSIIDYQSSSISSNSLIQEKFIIMNDYFSSFFTTIEFNFSIIKFIEMDGLKIIILFLEYYYQILVYIQSFKNKNEINEIIEKM